MFVERFSYGLFKSICIYVSGPESKFRLMFVLFMHADLKVMQKDGTIQGRGADSVVNI